VEVGPIYRVPVHVVPRILLLRALIVLQVEGEEAYNRSDEPGQLYNVKALDDHEPPFFSHRNARLVQLDIVDKSGNVVPPWAMHATFRPGSLVMCKVVLHCQKYSTQTAVDMVSILFLSDILKSSHYLLRSILLLRRR